MLLQLQGLRQGGPRAWTAATWRSWEGGLTLGTAGPGCGRGSGVEGLRCWWPQVGRGCWHRIVLSWRWEGSVLWRAAGGALAAGPWGIRSRCRWQRGMVKSAWQSRGNTIGICRGMRPYAETICVRYERCFADAYVWKRVREGVEVSSQPHAPVTWRLALSQGYCQQ